MTTGFWAGSEKHVIAAISIYTVGALILGALGAIAVVYSGFFNVSAQVVDQAPLEWLLVTTREASITYHAKDIKAPAPTGAHQIENGYRFFKSECAMCHTMPGGLTTIMSEGLNPRAPALANLVDMKDAEIFWAVKNGIRFTGMPGWESSRTDQELWDVVAFLRASLTMKTADYEALDRRTSP